MCLSETKCIDICIGASDNIFIALDLMIEFPFPFKDKHNNIVGRCTFFFFTANWTNMFWVRMIAPKATYR